MKDYDPASPLPDAEQERFVQAVFMQLPSRNARTAYLSVWPNAKPKSADTLASRLLRKVEIQARLRWLQEQVANANVASKQELAEGLTQMFRATLADFLTMSADGVWFHSIGPETLNQKALKKAKTRVQTEKGSGNTVIEKQFDEIELESKVAVAKALAELLGYNAPKQHELGGCGGKPIEHVHRIEKVYVKRPPNSDDELPPADS